MASEKDPSPQFTGGVGFAVNLNIERIFAQGSELLVGEFKSSADLAVGGRVNLENLNDRSRLCGRAIVKMGARCS